MALSSSSTYDDALAQYKDNLSWDGDVPKARAALEAVRFLLLQRPTRYAAADGRGGDYESLADVRRQLEEFLDSYDSTNRPRASWVQGRARM